MLYLESGQFHKLGIVVQYAHANAIYLLHLYGVVDIYIQHGLLSIT